MAQAFSIEVSGRSAGIAIAERGGFVFVAADRTFSALEGQIFRHLRHAERAAERVLFAPAEAQRA